MEEGQFHEKADGVLDALLDAIESADVAQVLEVDLLEGILTIELSDGRQFIINKHAPTCQLWLSSPMSGATHFSYNEMSNGWVSGDKDFHRVLVDEIRALSQVVVTL